LTVSTVDEAPIACMAGTMPWSPGGSCTVMCFSWRAKVWIANTIAGKSARGYGWRDGGVNATPFFSDAL